MSESPAIEPSYRVFLGIPNSGSILPCCVTGISQASVAHKVALAPSQFGDVCHNFNMLWSTALNLQEDQGFTHFAMLHTDIRPGAGWLDTLLEEMDRTDAEVLAAIVAIKDARGLTTTGLRRPHIWGTRRFTMKEVMALPETFDIEVLREGGFLERENELLAINTGCWVCRFPPGGWPAKFPGFQNEHRIRIRDGHFEPEFDSEDWLFSDWLASQGLRVFATRKVQTNHVGAFEFGNDSAWGSLQTDDWRPSRPSRQGEELEQAEAALDAALDRDWPWEPLPQDALVDELVSA